MTAYDTAFDAEAAFAASRAALTSLHELLAFQAAEKAGKRALRDRYELGEFLDAGLLVRGVLGQLV
jgi:hypothetical protein